MKLFPNGLSGRLMARGFDTAAANALVQRTLAQHGLAGSALSDSQPMMRGKAPSAPADPRFQPGAYACAAGARDYWLYTPDPATGAPKGLVVMLHGCTQTPQDFAAGTAMNVHAARHSLAVLYPGQARGANAQSCWNWFSKADQRRNRGEPAILSGMAAQIIAQHAIPPTRVFVAGLSAGGAMAVILAETYPEMFAAVGVHSGLPYGAACDVPSAFAAMAGQPAKGGLAGSGKSAVPTIVFHGSADSTVHPSNGQRIVQGALAGCRAQVQTVHQDRAAGRDFTCTITSGEGHRLVEHWDVSGMGHAWSGGQAAGSHTDAKGPDASAEMVRFFLQTAVTA